MMYVEGTCKETIFDGIGFVHRTVPVTLKVEPSLSNPAMEKHECLHCGTTWESRFNLTDFAVERVQQSEEAIDKLRELLLGGNPWTN